MVIFKAAEIEIADGFSKNLFLLLLAKLKLIRMLI